MDIFKCKYITHENEEIMGFCLNQNCQNTTQYCYKCLTTTHSDHQKDCIRFSEMNQYIHEFIQIYHQSTKQFKEISKSLQLCFEQILKIKEQDVKNLEKMIQQLQNKEYLVVKSQINIIKKMFTKEKENQIQKQIIYLNEILVTIKNMVTDLTQSSNERISDDEIKNEIKNDIKNEIKNEIKNKIKIKELQDEIQDKKEQKIIECERFFNEGQALQSLNKYEEAIECYDKAIAINPNYDVAWNSKGKLLYYSGLALHKLEIYKDAIQCFDKALNIQITPDRLKNKAYILLQLGMTLEARQLYLAALEKE
ncbi:unnamed protein product [Paramecium octaurelia]|uniref:Tetratricopeptide repeat protein n=1 Tax=Paramecium octaurelia TaxID=43137 RepID=A0A8S1YN36_PAROT|nr:unnamed protein product [Paramecium octaurelia]